MRSKSWLLSDEILYLDMTAAQKVVKPISQSAGDYLGSSDNATAKALFE